MNDRSLRGCLETEALTSRMFAEDYGQKAVAALTSEPPDYGTAALMASRAHAAWLSAYRIEMTLDAYDEVEKEGA